tara:strand:+ start:8685 stop:8876 length:192 start_codon:yes stop_codon:yes gene_type:complete
MAKIWKKLKKDKKESKKKATAVQIPDLSIANAKRQSESVSASHLEVVDCSRLITSRPTAAHPI